MTLNKKEIARSFGRAASTYDQYAYLQREIGEDLMARFHNISLQDKVVLDPGAGTGFFTQRLKDNFNCDVIAFDLAFNMLSQLNKNYLSVQKLICGDAESLPFKDKSVDVIFSNLTFQWCVNLNQCFKEVNRILKKGGTFCFSTLGPRTLWELRRSWEKVDNKTHVNHFVGLDYLREYLVSQEFDEVSLERELKVIQYQEAKTLLTELKGIGAHNINTNRSLKVMGKNRFKSFISAYEGFRSKEGFLPATYEIFYGVIKK